MKNTVKTMVLLVAISVVVGGIPAMAEQASVGAVAPGLTLSDFQRAYNGDKPIVAWHKYQDYKYRLNHPVPAATLNANRIRTDSAEWSPSSGADKPHIATMKQNGMVPQTQVGVVGTSFSQSYANLKPGMASFLKNQD